MPAQHLSSPGDRRHGDPSHGTLLSVSEPWSVAWSRALYGHDGFFIRERPLDHFRTSVANPLFAEAMRELAHRVDDALGLPDPFDVVDVGAGGGELLGRFTDVPARWRLTNVDVERSGRFSAIPSVTGLLVANEWLDAIPLDVLIDGRLVRVSPSGQEMLGPPTASLWGDRWWPGARRVEDGSPRDAAWTHAVSRVRRGLAVAVDYGHDIGSRRATLTGYRAGRQVPPVPDGSCDLTAHVALDSCAAATGARLLTQREALTWLGVSAALPTGGPTFATDLQRASRASELLDPDGWGGFGWLVQAVGVPDLLPR